MLNLKLIVFLNFNFSLNMVDKYQFYLAKSKKDTFFFTFCYFNCFIIIIFIL